MEIHEATAVLLGTMHGSVLVFVFAYAAKAVAVAIVRVAGIPDDRAWWIWIPTIIALVALSTILLGSLLDLVATSPGERAGLGRIAAGSHFFGFLAAAMFMIVRARLGRRAKERSKPAASRSRPRS